MIFICIIFYYPYFDGWNAFPAPNKIKFEYNLEWRSNLQFLNMPIFIFWNANITSVYNIVNFIISKPSNCNIYDPF